MKRAVLVFLTVSGLILSSCVKEDRGICPCLVRFDVGNMEVVEELEEGVVEIFVFNREGKIVFEDMHHRKEGLVVETLLERGEYTVAAYLSSGGIYGMRSGGRILIPWGNQGAAFYGSSTALDANCDFVSVCPAVHKQFSRISIFNASVAESGPGEAFQGYGISVSGSYGAYDLRSCAAVHNELYFIAEAEGGEFSFILPRQTDQGDKKLIFTLKDRTFSVASVELWRLLEAAAYPWDDADLPDVRIGVDFKSAQVHISVAIWKDEVVESLM